MPVDVAETTSKTEALLDTINLLYASVCDLNRWEDFLGQAAELLDSRGAQVGHHDMVNNELSFSRLFGYEWSDEHYQKYDSLMSEDPRLPHFANNPFKPIHCRMSISDHELHASRVYQEVLRPGGVEYSLGVSLHDNQDSLSYFLALRGPSEPQFSDEECRTLEQLIPHLRRAMQLQREMATLDLEKQFSLEALDSMGVGLMILDKDLRIHFQNDVAAGIVATDDGLRSSSDVLGMSASNADCFKKHVRSMITGSSIGNPPKGQSMRLERPSGKSPFQVFISPFWGERLRSGWAHIRRPMAFVVLQDPLAPRESRQELLVREFGLTPSQSNLTSLMCEGASLQEAATIAGITEASARQYLKLVFQKMGVSRQGEMVSKVLSLQTLG